jgi:MFS family permease
MTLRIEDYALIGNCRTAALVGRDGSIDWLCWPRFDSSACFAALLGTAENGRWLIVPKSAPVRINRRYRPGTLVLETEFETDTGSAAIIDFMPPADGADLVRIVLFQFANASMLPLVGERLAYRNGTGASFVISALIILPQIVVAISAPSVGQLAQSWGRRPLLLIGFGALAVRALLFAVTVDPPLLICIQLLDGVSGSVLGVLTALIIADLTNGTGRFNLAQGFVGMLPGVGAVLSTTFFGLIVGNFGSAIGFLSIAAAALITVFLAWLLMPETGLPETKRLNEKSEPLRSA